MGPSLALVVLAALSQTTTADAPVVEASDAGASDVHEVAAPLPALEPVDAGVAALTPPPASPSAPPSVAEAQAPSEGFVKGELSVYLGSGQLVVKNNRIGVAAGVEFLDNALYLLIEPLVDLRFFDGKLGLGIGVPIHLELFNLEADAEGPILGRHAGWFRTADYRGFHDYGKILKYVTYGRKEDNLYVNVGQRYAATLGHGALMRRYAPNVDVDYQRVSAEVDAYNDFGGFELMTNDVLEWNMLAGLAFLKPLSFLKSGNVFTRSLSVGFSAATDLSAPERLSRRPSGSRLLDATGSRFVTENRPIGFIGFDVEAKVVKTDNVDLKPYVDYSHLLGGNGGLTVGLLGRFNAGTTVVHAFRTVAEFRVLGSKYIPSYFDTFYEVERFVAGDVRLEGEPFADYITKRQKAFNGVGDRVGYYFEASWGIRNAVGFTVALEGVSNSAEKNFVAHLEVPFFNFLQLFGSYYKRGFVHFAEFAQAERSVVFAGARLRALPFLFLNGRVYKTFRVNPALERYDNQFGFAVDLEVGWEFAWARKSEQAKQLEKPPPDESKSTTPATEPAPKKEEAPTPAPAPAPAG
jgi:hypothetical protein